MQEIPLGFNALLIKNRKVQHKFEIRVEIYSLGFYLLEFKDKKQIKQNSRQDYQQAKAFLMGLQSKYKALGCSIYPLDGVIKFNYNPQTLLYEPKN